MNFQLFAILIAFLMALAGSAFGIENPHGVDSEKLSRCVNGCNDNGKIAVSASCVIKCMNE